MFNIVTIYAQIVKLYLIFPAIKMIIDQNDQNYSNFRFVPLA